MKFFMVIVFVCLIIGLIASPLPGGSTKKVKHRIHVPTKVHTVFITKVVKVPEHHHHHHTVVKKEPHNHKDFSFEEGAFDNKF